MNFTTDRKAWQEKSRIQKMLPRHFRILELAVAGMNGPEIALEVGLTSRSVSMIMSSPIFQQELAYRRKDNQEPKLLKMDLDASREKANSILTQAAEVAASRVVTLIASQDGAIALRAADSILDRVFGKGDKTGPQIINITAENVNLLNQALQESNTLKESRHVRSLEQPADSPPANPSQDEQGDVQQAPQGGAEVERCGSIQDQDAQVAG